MTQQDCVHATCISYQDKGLLITGPAGAGKSGLALACMALGAGLVADDRVMLHRSGAGVLASCPETLTGMIEARGIGILNARPAAPVLLAAVVDLARSETARHPVARDVILLEETLPLLWAVSTPHFPAMILQYLAHGRSLR